MEIQKRKLSSEEIFKSHLDWYRGLATDLRQLSDKVSAKMQMVEERKEYAMDDDESLAKMFFIHLDEYVSRANEVGPLGVGGIEPDITLSTTWNAMANAISNLWNDASMAYIHGDFRGCIFLSATMTEGALKLKMQDSENYKKWLEKKKKPMLGDLIAFLKHQKESLVPNEVIDLAERVNQLRVEHIHLLVEEEPQGLSSITPRDEFVPLNDFKGSPPIQIRDGYVSGDGVILVVDFREKKTGILYKYKKDAKKIVDCSRELLRKLYPAT